MLRGAPRGMSVYSYEYLLGIGPNDLYSVY